MYRVLSVSDVNGGFHVGKPFILGIVGSPRRNGNTERLLKLALEEAEKHGSRTELIALYDKKIKSCRHCDRCVRERDGECVIKDDFQPIMEKMSQADGLILASPVYFGYASPYLSALTSRTRCKFFTEEGTPLANKLGASIAVGGMRYGGQELTMHNIWGFYCVHNMIIINSDKKPKELKFPNKYKIVTFNATGIAVKHKLGTLTAPIVNTSVVGAVVKILKLARIKSLLEAVREGVPIKPEENAAAAKEAFEKA